jgi:hypothetical protein
MRKLRNREKKTEEPQYDLGLQEPYSNKLHSFKQKVELRLKRLETKAFIRSFLPWFYIVVSLSFIAVQAYYIKNYYDDLPSQIPLLQYYMNLQKKLVPSYYIYLIPGFSVAILLICLLPSYKWYNKKKDLAKFTLFFMMLSILMLTIALTKIFSQYYG